MNAVIIPNSQYNDAIALMDDGEYEEAIYLFESLNNYKDSVEKISECNMLFAEKKYDNACTLIDNNQYSEAVVIFRSLGEYKDSAEKVGLCEEKIIEKFEKENRLSGYIEVTIDQLMRNYLKYNGKKIKVVGSIYRLFYETPTFAEYHYEGALVNSNYFVLENRLDFRIMKSEFKSRPVYLSRDDRIKAHFTTCFLALIIFRYLEKKLEEKYTIYEIIDTLKEMNFLKVI